MSKLKKALEKAKEDRTINQCTQDQLRKYSDYTLKLNRINCESLRQEVQVTYSQTKVQQIDPKILKKNKVISYFQDNPMTQQINMLRTQVLTRLQESGGNTLLITSANPGEGKTFTTINLGISIAYEMDRTVLIVDADLKTPSVHHYDFSSDFFGIDVDQGISDYLMGRLEISEILLNPGIQKLTILPAGQPLTNSAELLGSPRMESLMNEMKSRYPGDRVIIIDGPALLKYADPVVLSRFADGILFVSEEEKTSRDDIKRALELLNGRPVFGTVLNKSKSSRG